MHYNASSLIFTRSSANKKCLQFSTKQGQSTGIAFGTVAKVWLGCNKWKARDHQTWKMGERRTAAGSRRRAMPGSGGMMVEQTFSRTSVNSMGTRNGPSLVWLKDLFPRHFWMQSLLPSTVHVTKKHSSWFDLVRILTIPDARETRGDNFAAKPILCFVVFSKLVDVYSKLSSSWIFCSVPGVFFPSLHLYLKGSSDLDRVGSMVGKQDWLKYGDRVQFAEMMDQRSSAEFTWTELLSWATFDIDVYSAARVKILDCHQRLHDVTSCS